MKLRKSTKAIKSELYQEMLKMGLTLHSLQVKKYHKRPMYVASVSKTGKSKDSLGMHYSGPKDDMIDYAKEHYSLIFKK